MPFAVLPFLLLGQTAKGQGLQSGGSGGGTSILQQRYDQAQRYQSANNLTAAAQQYRIFVADALGEIGVGLAQARDFDGAANDFDEALRLVPEFPVLRLQYARAALQAGKLERARLQAEQVLTSIPLSKQAAAGAHEVLGRVLLKMDKDTDAKAEFEQAVALEPTFENGYELAVADLDLGDAKAAAGLFGEMVKSYGDQARLHMYFGEAYAASDAQAEAMAEFKRALGQDPRLPGLHYCLAVAYLAQGDTHVNEAEAELRREIAIAPNDAPAFAALGHLLAGRAGDPASIREAEQDLKHATELDPTNPDAFLFLAQLDAQQNRSDEAINELRRSIALTTDPSRNAYQVQKAHYLLGRLLVKAGQEDQGKAELAISEALMHSNLRRDQKQLSEYLGDAHGGDGAVAVPEALGGSSAPDPAAAGRVKALEARLAPAIADSYNNLGAIAAGQSDYRSAVLAFERAAEWKPQLAGLDYNWGRAAFAGGMVREAIGPLERYVRAHPGDEGGRAVLGLCLFADKQFAQTREVLAPLQKGSDTATQIRFAYADSLIETGDVSEGIAQMEALAKSDPKIVDVHRALGRAYAMQKSPQAAHEYEVALTLNPNDVQSLAGLAKLQLESGDANGAVLRLKRALELQPADATLQQEMAEASRRADHP